MGTETWEAFAWGLLAALFIIAMILRATRSKKFSFETYGPSSVSKWRRVTGTPEVVVDDLTEKFEGLKRDLPNGKKEGLAGEDLPEWAPNPGYKRSTGLGAARRKSSYIDDYSAALRSGDAMTLYDIDYHTRPDPTPHHTGGGGDFGGAGASASYDCGSSSSDSGGGCDGGGDGGGD